MNLGKIFMGFGRNTSVGIWYKYKKARNEQYRHWVATFIDLLFKECLFASACVREFLRGAVSVLASI
jgi:hypothetical protein